MERNNIKEIVENNRHMFIYSEDKNMVDGIIQNALEQYPIISNQDVPMVVSLDNLNLVGEGAADLDKIKIMILAREYLSFSIVSSILGKLNGLSEEMQAKILKLMNESYLNLKAPNILSMEELKKELSLSVSFYKHFYNDYVKTGVNNYNIDDIKIQFIEADFIAKRIRKILNNNSYFKLLVKYDEQPTILINAINSMVNSRINGNISMGVLCGPKDWNYYDLCGQVIEAIHDYDTVDIDGSYSQYSKSLKK